MPCHPHVTPPPHLICAFRLFHRPRNRGDVLVGDRGWGWGGGVGCCSGIVRSLPVTQQSLSSHLNTPTTPPRACQNPPSSSHVILADATGGGGWGGGDPEVRVACASKVKAGLRPASQVMAVSKPLARLSTRGVVRLSTSLLPSLHLCEPPLQTDTNTSSTQPERTLTNTIHLHLALHLPRSPSLLSPFTTPSSLLRSAHFRPTTHCLFSPGWGRLNPRVPPL